MGVTVTTFRPVDFAVLGLTGARITLRCCPAPPSAAAESGHPRFAGVAMAVALFGAWFTVPWKRKNRRATQEFNVLWPGRVALELTVAVWVVRSVCWSHLYVVMHVLHPNAT